MKSVIFIFVVFAGALNAELPPGATDLIPRSESPAAEILKIKVDSVSAKSSVKITTSLFDASSSIDAPKIYISEAPKSAITK